MGLLITVRKSKTDQEACGQAAGFVTSAAARGANKFRIMDVSRHSSMAVDAFKDHAGTTRLL
jgi:hypothetical protein